MPRYPSKRQSYGTRRKNQVESTKRLRASRAEESARDAEQRRNELHRKYDYLVNFTPEMIRCGKDFDQLVSEIIPKSCSTCPRSSPALTLIRESCSACRSKKNTGVFKFSAQNNMDPGDVPPQLQDLTYIEQMLIAQIHPIVTLFRVQGNQWKYHGNVISFRQNIERYASV